LIGYPTFCFKFNLSNVTDSVSRSRHAVPVALLSRWPEREKKKNEREREREREKFYFKGREI